MDTEEKIDAIESYIEDLLKVQTILDYCCGYEDIEINKKKLFDAYDLVLELLKYKRYELDDLKMI